MSDGTMTESEFSRRMAEAEARGEGLIIDTKVVPDKERTGSTGKTSHTYAYAPRELDKEAEREAGG